MSTNSTNTADRPLFIALKAEYFLAFERGDKSEEYRPYGACWNERVCRVGRVVTLSLGFARGRRVTGVITGFRIEPNPVETLPGWTECYGKCPRTAAVIVIKLNNCVRDAGTDAHDKQSQAEPAFPASNG